MSKTISGRVALQKQVGASATPRGSSGPAGWLSVMDPAYGAVGDGVTDNAPAIQAAITAANAGGAAVGGCVFFPKPKAFYNILSTINVPSVSGQDSNLRLLGTGPGSIIQAGAVMDAIFAVTGAGVEFSELEFANPGGSIKAATAISATISSAYPLPGLNVNKCYFNGFTYGILATGQNHGICENLFWNCERGIRFTNDGRNTYIDRNYFLGCNSGIEFIKASQQVEGSRITNNAIFCTEANGAAIHLSDGLEIYIAGNIIDQTGRNGPNTSGIVLGDSGGTISRIRMFGNWIKGGPGGYCVFAAGNNNFLEFVCNTFVAADDTVTGISLDHTDNFLLLKNNWLGAFAQVASLVSTSRGTILADSTLETDLAVIGRAHGTPYIARIDDTNVGAPAWIIEAL